MDPVPQPKTRPYPPTEPVAQMSPARMAALLVVAGVGALGFWSTAGWVQAGHPLPQPGPGETLTTITALVSSLAVAGLVYALLAIHRALTAQRLALETLQREQMAQTALLAGQLRAMESEQQRQRLQDEAMAEPLLNSKGGTASAGAKRIEFENAGATVMELSVKSETPGFLTELYPRLVLRSSDSGYVTLAGAANSSESDVALAFSYVTRLGKRGVKHFIVPAGECSLIEQPRKEGAAL